MMKLYYDSHNDNMLIRETICIYTTTYQLLGLEESPLRCAVSVGLGSIICVPPLQTRRDICMNHTIALLRGRCHHSPLRGRCIHLTSLEVVPGKLDRILTQSFLHKSLCDDCFAPRYIFGSGQKIVTAGLLMHVHVLDFVYEVRHNAVLMRCICLLGFYEYGA